MFNIFWWGPSLLVIAEVIAFLNTRRTTRLRRGLTAAGAYLICVALWFAFSLLVQDQLGFSLIPAMCLGAPWFFLAPVARYLLGHNLYVVIAFGTAANCILFYLIGYYLPSRPVAYPKTSS